MAIKFFKPKEDKFDYKESRTCKCCDNVFEGRYCNVCGEKVIESYERSFLGFLENLLNAFTFLDGKFIRSLRLLITRPGQLSRNIANGIRAPYMKMISLFFVANFFYFLFPFFDSFNSSLYSQLNLMGSHSVRAKEIVKVEIEKRQISMEEFQEKYQAQSTNLSKLLLITLVLAMTAILMIINYSKRNYFFDHLLISLEFYSFHLLINMLLLPFILFLIIKIAGFLNLNWRFLMTDEIFSWPVRGLIFYFLVRLERTFYTQRWIWAIPKALILLFVFRETVSLYRMLLFYITVWTT